MEQAIQEQVQQTTSSDASAKKGDKMKKLILTICFILISSQAFSSWYIFNAENRCVGITQYEPDSADIESRGEFKVFTNATIPLVEAEYLNGKVKKRVKSQAEKNADKELEDEADEMAQVYHKMFTKAYKDLKAEGKTFNHMHKHIDPDDL